ncbi:MAG: carboxypeptidase-like regulatory domain-containing protein, partial [Halobacteriales archaeon]|nr:carboxypeptidase-like regulatory domain-containing protein [Halobacteriales archaeon]
NVSTSNGTPVENAQVEILGASGVALVMTDANGDYTMGGLPEGSYDVNVVGTPTGFGYAGGVKETYLMDGEAESLDFTAIAVAVVNSSAGSGPGSLAEAFAMLSADPDLGGIAVEGLTSPIVLNFASGGVPVFNGSQDVTILGNGATIDASGVPIGMIFAGAGSVAVHDLRILGGGTPAAGILFFTDRVTTGDPTYEVKDVTVRDVVDTGLAFLDWSLIGPSMAPQQDFDFQAAVSQTLSYERVQKNAEAVGGDAEVDDDGDGPEAPVYDYDLTIPEASFHTFPFSSFGMNIILDGVIVDNAMGFEGIAILEASTGDVDLTVMNSRVTNTGTQGMVVLESGPGHLYATVDGSHFAYNGSRSLAWEEGVQLVELDDGDLTANISRTTVTKAGDDGLDVNELGDGNLRLTLDQVHLTSNHGEGLDFYEESYGDATLEYRGGTAQFNEDGGLELYESSYGDLYVDLRDLVVRNNDDEGIEIDEYSDGSLTLMASNVETFNNGDDGLRLDSDDDGSVTVSLTDFVSTSNGGDNLHADIEDNDGYAFTFNLTRVTLTKSDEDGFDLESDDNDGPLTVNLNHVVADDNEDNGLELEKDDCCDPDDFVVRGADVWVRNNRSGPGFQVEDNSDGHLIFEIDRLYVTDTSSGHGLELKEDDDGDLIVDLLDAVITRNEGYGVWLDEDSSGQIDGLMRSSQITHNLDDGLYISEGGGTLDLISTLISGNIPEDIDNNGGTVITSN